MHKAKVYVINLARRPDRLAAVSGELERAGVTFQRVDAVDAQNCVPAELDISRRTGPIGELGPGARACTASHFRVWRQFLQSADDFAVVLEDDVMVDPDLGTVLSDLSWIKADLVKIEKFGATRPSTLLLGPGLSRLPAGRELRPLLSRHTGSAGYIISRRAAEVALGYSGQLDVPTDHFLFNATVSRFARGIRPAIVVAPLVWQAPDHGLGSDIAARRERNWGWARFRRSLVRSLYEARLWHRQIAALVTGHGRLVTIEVPRR